MKVQKKNDCHHFNCTAAIAVAADPVGCLRWDFLLLVIISAYTNSYQNLVKYNSSNLRPDYLQVEVFFMYEDLIKEIADLILLITDQSKLKRIIAFIRSMI